jgi:hypothetical protein
MAHLLRRMRVYCLDWKVEILDPVLQSGAPDLGNVEDEVDDSQNVPA